jgi:hypothetical protein
LVLLTATLLAGLLATLPVRILLLLAGLLPATLLLSALTALLVLLTALVLALAALIILVHVKFLRLVR